MTLQEKLDQIVRLRKVRYPEDVERIQMASASRLDVKMTPQEAERIWRWWSDLSCAGWLTISSDEEIAEAISSYIEQHSQEMT